MVIIYVMTIVFSMKLTLTHSNISEIHVISANYCLNHDLRIINL